MIDSRLITVEEAQAMLPQVGARLWKVPTLHKSLGMTESGLRPCVVTYVNREHLWFEVLFEDYGYAESYKVPELKLGPKGGWPT